MNLQVRAASPDNDSELRQIVGLFQANYGRHYPLRHVYDLNFWKSRICSRMASLVGFNGEEIVAHLALRPDLENPGYIQVLYPVVSPKLGSQIGALATQAVELIDRLASRQQWKLIYQFTPIRDERAMLFATQQLGLRESALLPDYLPLSPWNTQGARKLQRAQSSGRRREVERRKRRRDTIAVMFRVFSDDHQQIPTVYLPKQHVPLSSEIYGALGLQREISAQLPRGRRRDVSRTDDRGIHIVRPRESKAAHVFVEPGLLDSPEDELNRITEDPEFRPFLFINLHDPQTIEFCKIAERRGFVCCGIIPHIRGRDSIVYALPPEDPVDTARVSSLGALRLASYVEEGSTLELEQPRRVAQLG